MKKEVKEQTETAYTKEQFVTSNSYKDYKEVLQAVLKEDKEYTKTEVETILKQFMKGKVK